MDYKGLYIWVIWSLFWLVVEPTPSEKYEIQLEGLSHILWNIRFMFQTTNQLWMFMIDLTLICWC